jgi:hypothetical protein
VCFESAEKFNLIFFLGKLQVLFYWILVLRHIAYYFETRPQLRPPFQTQEKSTVGHRITLSDTQLAQISEIFDLFDTDGGGSIDRRELDLALVALGFQKEKKSSRQKESAALDSIVQDGNVSRSEFRQAWNL